MDEVGKRILKFLLNNPDWQNIRTIADKTAISSGVARGYIRGFEKDGYITTRKIPIIERIPGENDCAQLTPEGRSFAEAIE